MPAKDIYHQAVKHALLKDGWTILSEDYVLEYDGDKLYADIAAQKYIAAQRQEQKIIVEVKSFLGRSFFNDLESAIGQYIIYRNILQAKNLDFNIYMAVPSGVYSSKFQKKLAQLIVQANQVNLLVFDSNNEVLKQWIS